MEERKADTGQDLYVWIDEISSQVPFSRPNKNLARDFSDGVLVAELIHFYFPRFVELHNYPSANSHLCKVANWDTLNRKVLPKLKLHLTTSTINELSRANIRAIQKVLLELKHKIDFIFAEEAKHSDEELQEFSDEIVKVPVTNNEGDTIYKKMVPVVLLETVLLESRKKDTVISSLRRKIQHLEGLLMLKEARIEDLSAQLSRPLENRALN